MKFYQFTKLEAVIAEAQKEGKSLSSIDIIAPNMKDVLNEVITEVSSKGIVPIKFYVLLFEFCILWYFVATLMTTTLGLIYYRKFKSS